jgi:hypothetical protein
MTALRRTAIAPAATMTSLRAKAVNRVELFAEGANSMPEALRGGFLFAQLIFVT